MIYRFSGKTFTEGSRAFINIPFNLWEETGLRGNIPCRVSIRGLSFECKLIPKGNGKYLIHITKKTLSELKAEEEYDIEMEPIEALTRINHESPYSKEHPIRKIDSIETIPIQAGFCGHCCVAMLSGEPLCDVVKLMGKGPASWSKILEALDYYGISYAERAFYTKGEPCQLPQCAIVYNDNSFLLWFKGSFYGVKDIEMKKTVNYVEVFVV